MKVVGDSINAGECECGQMERAFWNITKLCGHPCHPGSLSSPLHPDVCQYCTSSSNAGLALSTVKLIPPAHFLFERFMFSLKANLQYLKVVFFPLCFEILFLQLLSAIFVFKEHELRLHTHYMHRKEERYVHRPGEQVIPCPVWPFPVPKDTGCSTMTDMS